MVIFVTLIQVSLFICYTTGRTKEDRKLSNKEPDMLIQFCFKNQVKRILLQTKGELNNMHLRWNLRRVCQVQLCFNWRQIINFHQLLTRRNIIKAWIASSSRSLITALLSQNWIWKVEKKWAKLNNSNQYYKAPVGEQRLLPKKKVKHMRMWVLFLMDWKWTISSNT